jgi:RHS repeat-associated protein
LTGSQDGGYIIHQSGTLFNRHLVHFSPAVYTHGPGIDEPLIMERNGQNYFYLTDGLGSVVKLVDAAGSVVNNYVYDSFGNIINKTEGVTNPYTYTGREYDPESGLYYYRFRYYDASIGRFISLDPILELAIQETPELLPDLLLTFQVINQYVYVHNNPINHIDPYGLWYGTTDCSYYVRRCNEAGGGYYCYVAPFICEYTKTIPLFAFTNWDECTRQCLQEYDQLYCSKNNGNNGQCDESGGGNGADIKCTYEAHKYCFVKCFQNPHQRPSFAPQLPVIGVRNGF